jgi:hypothetical protein
MSARIGHSALSVWTVDRIERWREKMILGESLPGWELRNELSARDFWRTPACGAPWPVLELWRQT